MGRPPEPGRTLAAIAGLALAYFAAGWLALLVAEKPGNVSALWPPSGIALAAVLVLGRRVWPGVLLGSAALNLFFFPSSGGLLVRALGPLLIGLGSSAEVLVASLLVQRCAGGRAALATPARVLMFVGSVAVAGGIAAMTGLLATAGLGTMALELAPKFVATWWLGDSVGMLIVAPLVFETDVRLSARRHEVLALALATTLLCQLVFGRPLPSPVGLRLPVAWLLMLPAIWSGLRLGGRAVSLQTLLAYGLVSWAVLDRRGPFGTVEPATALLLTDALLVALQLIGLLLASASARIQRSHDELEEARRSLERKVEERTRSLANANEAIQREVAERELLGARLVEAEKREALGRLAGGIAHDFNNLLTVIGCEAGLIASAPEVSVRTREAADAIQTTSKRASDLTRQLLAVARRQPVAPRVVELGGVVEAVSRLVRPLLPKEVDLEIAQDGPCHVEIDPIQLDQVLLNLAINARDAMPSGGALAITMGTRELAAAEAAALGLSEGAWVWCRIRDTGEGIPADVMPRIFEPFFTTKPSGSGSGLGLSTAAGIVEQAGGLLTVTSTPGDGATFTIWLPRAAAPAAAPAHESTPSVPVAATVAPPTVLVAEDEEMIRRLLVRALERAGFQVLAGADGVEALALAQDHGIDRIDLVLTDVRMPGMEGPELVRRLRAAGPMPALYISGFIDQIGDVPREDLLTKPFGTEEVVRAVRARLARATRRAREAEPHSAAS